MGPCSIVSFERPVNEDIGQHATAEAAQFVPAQHAIPRQPRPVGSSRCTAIGQCVECLGSSSIIFGAWKRDKNIYTDLKHPEGPTRWNCRKKYQEIEIFSRIWQVNPTWQYYTIFMSPADAIPRSGWIKIHKLGYCKPYRFNMNPQRSKLWPCQKVAFSSFSFAVSGNHVFTSGMSGFVRGSGDDSHQWTLKDLQQTILVVNTATCTEKCVLKHKEADMRIQKKDRSYISIWYTFIINKSIFKYIWYYAMNYMYYITIYKINYNYIILNNK